MELDVNKNYWFSAPKDPELSDQNLEFLETPAEFASRVLILRNRGYFLDDRQVVVLDKPGGSEVSRMWMSQLVETYFTPCKLCGSYGGECVCDDEADR